MNPLQLYLTFLILFIFLGSPIASAQDAEVKDEPKTEISHESLAKESKALLKEIHNLSKKTAALRLYVKKTAEVDRLLFISLMAAIEEKLRSKLDRLMEIKTSLDKNKAYADLNLHAIQAIVREQSTVLQGEIKKVSDIVIKMRNKKNKEDFLHYAIDRAEKKVDILITEWHRNIQRGIALKLDMAEENSKLTQLIQLRSIGLSGRIRLALDAINNLKGRSSNATEEQKKKITQQLYDLELRKTEAAYNLKNMVGLMGKQGIETTEFGKVLIVATGNILSENVDTKAVVGIFQATLNDAMAWWKENFPLIIFRLISFILILLAFKILAGIVSRLVNRLTNTSDQSSQLLNNFFRSVVSKTIMIIGFVVALSQLGIEIGPLLAGMGVMGFVVGFALQDTLSNFASGMMILVYRPYDVGDFVNVSGISGQVKDMNLVSTTVLTIDHQRMVIPNSKIWGDIITNVTAERLRRVDMVFGISYSDSIEKTEAVLHKMMHEHPLILDEPEPLIKVHTLSTSSVDFIVRPWVNSKDYWDVYWDITRKVKEEFDMAGISIPFPQQDVHLYPTSENN
jgi:small conductance mechanosensitive channel